MGGVGGDEYLYPKEDGRGEEEEGTKKTKKVWKSYSAAAAVLEMEFFSRTRDLTPAFVRDGRIARKGEREGGSQCCSSFT